MRIVSLNEGNDKPQKEKEIVMKRFSALMLGAAMVLGTAFAAQEAASTPAKPAATSTKKVAKKHSKKSKKSAKKVAAATATTTTPAPAK